MNTGFVIAIDGPVASGKGTIAPALARSLHGFCLYTGAMYRCVALLCRENNIAVSDTEAIIAACQHIQITFNEDRVLLNNQDVSSKLQDPEVATLSSKVAAIPQVRKKLVFLQQSLANAAVAKGQIVIAEGRDMGTRVFPNAAMKLYLTASDDVRAKRRLDQYTNQGDTNYTISDILLQIKQRDEQDKSRVTDPLVRDPENHDYFVVDSTNLTSEQTIEIIQTELRKRNLI